MAIKVIRKWVRPSVDVPFYTYTPELTAHINNTYDNTGKRTSLELFRSEDGLTSIAASIWTNEDAVTEFVLDPEIVESGAMAENYNKLSGIIQTIEKSEV